MHYEISMIRTCFRKCVEYRIKGVVCQEKQPMITNTNQAYFAELGARGFQEVILGKEGVDNTYKE
jgi:hypothetical protein